LDKAKAETGVKVVETLLARLRKRQFFGLEEINAALRPLLDELNERTMEHLGKSRRQLYEELDRPALRPLPAEPFETAEWSRARVNIDYHIAFAKHNTASPTVISTRRSKSGPRRRRLRSFIKASG